MAGSDPHILLIGGDGGYSGVPTYLTLLTEALQGTARFTLLSDHNSGGYDKIIQRGGDHVGMAGLRTTLNPFAALRALRQMARILDSRQPDLIWAHARMGVLLLRLLAIWRHLRGHGLPTVAITFHGLPFGPGHRPVSAPLSWLAECWFLRLMPPHHLLFLSEAAAQSYAAGPGRGGRLARHQVHVLHNCSRLDPPEAAPRAKNPLIVMAGRSGYQKNHAAAARILARLPDSYRLAICGAGTDRPEFRRSFVRAARLPEAEIARRVSFLGPTADVRPLLQQADAFLMTSRYEGMPIAAIEAFEAGLPLALPDIPGLSEIAAAHPMGSLLQTRHPAQAAAQIVALVERYRRDPARCNGAIRAAWQRHFSFMQWRRDLIALTERMTGAASQGAERDKTP